MMIVEAADNYGDKSFPYVFIVVSKVPHDLEAYRKESSSQEVTQGGQERDGDIVRVVPPLPDLVDQPVSHHQQYGHLQVFSTIAHSLPIQ